MRIAFFEDQLASRFGPIALFRPVFELLCGRFSVRERALLALNPADWGVFLRPSLADVYREQQPAARLNDYLWLAHGPTLLLNGRWIPTRTGLSSIRSDEAGYIGDEIAWLTIDSHAAARIRELSWDDGLERIARSRRPVEAEGAMVRAPWDLVNRNAEQLIEDFHLLPPHAPRAELEPRAALIGPAARLFVHPTAHIDPFVVIDVRQGPVYVGPGANIQAFTRLEGPCSIGANSQTFRANVRGGTTIGPVCRVGGEIEESILHGYVNKYHDGFLGHSYVSPWVNLGALTTNSDLKNDYTDVKVPLAGHSIPTGCTKVGCFIGDHTKTALASLFNTGSSIGAFCMILPGGELLPKHIPPFSRIWNGDLIDGTGVEDALKLARIAMSRRQQVLTPPQERLIRFLFDETKAERETAVLRAMEKQRRRNASATLRAS